MKVRSAGAESLVGSELRRQSVVDEAVVRRATAQDDGVPSSCSV